MTVNQVRDTPLQQTEHLGIYTDVCFFLPTIGPQPSGDTSPPVASGSLFLCKKVFIFQDYKIPVYSNPKTIYTVIV